MCLSSLFFRKMPKQKVNFGKGIFGIRKWQYERLDDIDLLSEISIFSSCSWPGVCRVCKKYLRWRIDILQKRWNNNRYVDFFDVLEVVKNNGEIFDNLKCLRRDYIQSLICRKNDFFNNDTFT